MNGVLNPGQRIAFSVEPKDRHGNDAVIDGPVAASTDNDLVTATVNEDGKSGFFHLAEGVQLDSVVAVTATVEFDSRLGDEVNEIVLTGALLIGPEEATQANSIITFGEAEDEPSDDGGETG